MIPYELLKMPILDLKQILYSFTLLLPEFFFNVSNFCHRFSLIYLYNFLIFLFFKSLHISLKLYCNLAHGGFCFYAKRILNTIGWSLVVSTLQHIYILTGTPTMQVEFLLE